MKDTIGRCSICGGAVTIPRYWLGVIPPVPTCESCGALRAIVDRKAAMTRRRRMPHGQPRR